MDFKRLFRRAGGMITAIALLASMMAVAGAAGSQMTYTCKLCGNEEAFHTGNWEPISMQEAYGVDEIPSLGANLVYPRGFSSRYFIMEDENNYLVICDTCVNDIVTQYKASLRDGTSVDSTTGAASVPVTVTRAAATFSVTVPTTLPVSVSADGTVTTATDAVITNNSGGPVSVTKVELTGQNDWTLAAYTQDILNLPVDTKQFGLQMNISDKTVATSSSGASEVLSDSLNARITKGQKCPVIYDALFPAQTTAASNEQIANVVFTVGWA